MRYLPIIATVFLWLVKVAILLSLGQYQTALGPSDVAFSGLSFDLWAFLTALVFNQPLVYKEEGDYVSEDYATIQEKVIIGAFIGLHFVIFAVAAIVVVLNPAMGDVVESNFLPTVLLAAMVTHIPPAMFLQRWFRGR